MAAALEMLWRKPSFTVVHSMLSSPFQLYYEQGGGEDEAANGSSGDEWIRLTRLYQFARNVRALLHTYHYNQIFLTDFQAAYNKFTGCSLESRSYGYMTTDELLSAIPQVSRHDLNSH